MGGGRTEFQRQSDIVAQRTHDAPGGIMTVEKTELQELAFPVGGTVEKGGTVFSNISLMGMLTEDHFSRNYLVTRGNGEGVTSIVPIQVESSDVPQDMLACGQGDLILKMDIQPYMLAKVDRPVGMSRRDLVKQELVRDIRYAVEYVQENGDPATTVIVAVTHRAVVDHLREQMPSQLAVAQCTEITAENTSPAFFDAVQRELTFSINASGARKTSTPQEDVTPYLVAIRVSDFLQAA